MNQALHFVAFRGEEFNSAVRVWGQPDFFHRRWDLRARQEIAAGDTVIFACGCATDEPSPFSHDDSNQPGDPAALERMGKL